MSDDAKNNKLDDLRKNWGLEDKQAWLSSLKEYGVTHQQIENITQKLSPNLMQHHSQDTFQEFIESNEHLGKLTQTTSKEQEILGLTPKGLQEAQGREKAKKILGASDKELRNPKSSKNYVLKKVNAIRSQLSHAGSSAIKSIKNNASSVYNKNFKKKDGQGR